MLNGFWKTQEGLFCFICGGECTFMTKGVISRLDMLGGLLTLNGWAACAIRPNSVSWRKGNQAMDWHRIEFARDLPCLNGAWFASDGAVCSVAEGTCRFAA